jgi:hypothetical protein
VIEPGMPVLSRDGHRIGCVKQVIEDDPSLPPGILIARSRFCGLFSTRVVLTTFDVQDVRGGSVLLRITRWDVGNRAGQLGH